MNQTQRNPDDLPATINAWVVRWTLRRQAHVVAIALAFLPILYVTLEIPKVIIDCILSDDARPSTVFGVVVEKSVFLASICAGFLLALLLCGLIKYWANVYSGRIGEIERRRLRLFLIRRWRRCRSRSAGGLFAPVIAHEVEPIGGFAGEAIKTPLLQGGAILVAIGFMLAQSTVLGLVALALAPIQAIVIPTLQRQVNALGRQRLVEIRRLNGIVTSDKDAHATVSGTGFRASCRRVQDLRFRLYHRKYLMKFLFNLLGQMVPGGTRASGAGDRHQGISGGLRQVQIEHANS